MKPDSSILNASPNSQAAGNVLALLKAHQTPSQNSGQAAPASQPTSSGDSGSGGIMGWLGRNASTLGSIGGGIAGELVDPFGGGIIGASLGSGLGKAVQNDATGQDIGSGVLGSTIEGGVGQAAGFGLGKLAGGLGGKLLSSAAKSVAKAAPGAADAAADAATKTKLFNRAFDGFENQAEPIRGMLEGHGVDTNLSSAGASANEAATALRGKASTLANSIVSPIQKIRDEETLKAGAGASNELPKNMFQDFIKSVNANAGVIGKQHVIDLASTPEDETQEMLEKSGLVRPKMKATGKNPVVNTADDLVTDVKNAIESPDATGNPGLKVGSNGEITGQVSTEQALNILNQISKTADKHFQGLTNTQGKDITNIERGTTTKLISQIEDQLQGHVYDQPGVMEGIQGRASEAADATRQALTQAGFEPAQIDQAIKSSADILDSAQPTDMGKKLSGFIANARTARSAEKFAGKSGAAREKLETAAAKAVKEPNDAAEASGGRSPALGVFHATPGGPLIKTMAAGAAHALSNPALRESAGNVLSKLAPTAGGDITKAGMAEGALGATTADGPLVNPPTTAAPAGQFTNQPGQGLSAMQPGMQPSAQTAQPNPMGSAMLNYALFNPQLLSTMLTTANQQSGQNYASQQAEQSLANLPAAPSGLGAKIESGLGVGAASRYNNAAQQAATQIAAAIPGADAGNIERQLTNYMAGGASIQQAQQALLQQLQLSQQQSQSGLSGLLAPAGLTQQPSVGMTPSLSTMQ